MKKLFNSKLMITLFISVMFLACGWLLVAWNTAIGFIPFMLSLIAFRHYDKKSTTIGLKHDRYVRDNLEEALKVYEKTLKEIPYYHYERNPLIQEDIQKHGIEKGLSHAFLKGNLIASVFIIIYLLGVFINPLLALFSYSILLFYLGLIVHQYIAETTRVREYNKLLKEKED